MAIAPELTVHGDVYRFTWDGDGIEGEIARVQEHRDGIYGEIIIRSAIEGLMYAGRINLLAAPTNHAKHLQERLDLDWFAMLQTACFLTVARYREGEPALRLCEVDWQTRPRWLLEPYIEHGGPTVLYAEGGSGKSTLALAMAYSIATGVAVLGQPTGTPVPVMYLDWETGPEVHAERLRAIAAAHGRRDVPNNIYYRAMRQSLPEAAATIRRDIHKLGIGLVIVDSLGAAGGAAPEESATALAVFAAIRSFAIPCLCVHHKRKSTGEKQNERDRLFGSVYYVNLCRLAWEVEAAGDEDNNTLRLALVNRKANNGRLLKRHGLELAYQNEGDALASIRIRVQQLSDMPEFTARMSLRERCLAELRLGAQSTAQLAEATEKPQNEVRARMSQAIKAGLVIQLPDGRWGLAARNG